MIYSKQINCIHQPMRACRWTEVKERPEVTIRDSNSSSGKVEYLDLPLALTCQSLPSGKRQTDRRRHRQRHRHRQRQTETQRDTQRDSMPVGFFFFSFFLFANHLLLRPILLLQMPVVDYGGMIVFMYTTH